MLNSYADKYKNVKNVGNVFVSNSFKSCMEKILIVQVVSNNLWEHFLLDLFNVKYRT